MSVEYKGIKYKDDTFTTCLHGNYGLKIAELHPNTHVIQADAFRESDIEKVILPEGLKTIQRRAFLECENLKEIMFPKSLTKIYESAFLECKSLKKVDLSQTKIKELQDDIFWKCENLEEVLLPEKLKKIFKYVFNETKLKEINLPSTLEYVGNNAFANTNIESIIIPENLEEISDYTFCNCKKLKTVNFGNVTKIGHNAFYGCENLKEVNLPETLLEFSPSSFTDTKIEEIFIPKNVEKIWYPGRAELGCLKKYIYETLPEDAEKGLYILAPKYGIEVEKKSFLDYMIGKNKTFKEINVEYNKKNENKEI